MMRRSLALLALIAAAALAPRGAHAKDPALAITSAVVNVQSTDAVFYGTSAADEGWGASLPSQARSGRDGERAWYRAVYTTAALTDAFGCTSPSALVAAANGSSASNTSSSTSSNSSSSANDTSADGSLSDEQVAALGLPAEPFVLLVDRGRCTFADKAWVAQRLGAAALLVTDTLEQVYNRSSTSGVTADARALEFSCAHGAAQAAGASEAALADFTAAGWADLVNVAKCTESAACHSDRCVPTGSGLQVCCAWDIPDYMGFGSANIVSDESAITIPVIRLTIADGDSLKALIDGSGSSSSSSGSGGSQDGDVKVTFYERDPPAADPAQAVLWLLAVATVLMGSYQGAAFERTAAQLRAALAAADTTSSEDSAQARVAYEEHLDRQAAGDGETLDLSIYHAVGFLVFASAFLVLLFYVNVVLVVVVLFAVGSVSSTFHVLWAPLLAQVVLLRRVHPMKNWLWQWEGVFEPATWTLGDLLALLLSIGVAVFWFLMRHENFAWVFQDIFGVCLCIMFLRTLRLPNVKIATVLLVLVFCYDIFMVFISPYIFKESVMIKVATSGASANADTSYCLRYPTDSEHDCVSESMPILLRMPKVLDWRESTTMLGLGDIVLPGLLLVLCARFDYATRGQLFGKVNRQLLGRIRSFGAGMGQRAPPSMGDRHTEPELNGAAVSHSRRGVFCMLLWGYAIGLFLANLAVSLTGDGQPALMYLVPCTLGLLAIIGWRRGILTKLWQGPPELVASGGGNANNDNAGAGNGPTRFRAMSLESGKPTSELVLMNDQTPISGSYAISESTPSEKK